MANGCCTAYMMLASARVHVGSEVGQEVVLWQPGEALIVDADMRHRGRRLALAEQGADGLALIHLRDPGNR